MPHAEARDGEIILQTAYDDLDVVRVLPARRWDRHARVWRFPATPEVARVLAEVDDWATPFTYDPGFEILLDQARLAYHARGNRTREDLPPLPGDADGTSWIHQRQAFWFAAGQQSAGLAIGMGGGKSRVAISLVEYWTAQIENPSVLIVTTPNGLGVWPDQFERWALGPWEVVNHGGRNSRGNLRKSPKVADRIQAANYAMKRPRHHGVAVVVHWQALPRMRHWLMAQRWDAIVLDESHNAKNTGGVWSKIVEALTVKAPHRLCLTGTPMPHDKLDIFAQTRFLDPGIFGRNFALYRARYAVMGGFDNREVIGWQNADEHEAKMSRVWYVATEDDLDLGLPPTHTLTRYFTLGARGERAYRELHDNFLTHIGDELVIAPHTLTRLLRLAQITGGWVPSDTGTEVHVDDGKATLLGEVLDEIGTEPVVVVARFRRDLGEIRRVAEGMGRRYGEVSGRGSDLTDDAKFPTGVDVLGVQIQAGSEAIDLTAARYTIFYSVGFDNGKYRQMLKRTHRPGQKHATTYIHLVASGTVDVVERAALDRKEDAAMAVLRAVRSERSR